MSNTKEQWEKRFYDPTIFWINPARHVTQRAILVSNNSGKFQLHTYDFMTGFSKQITKKSQGQLFGSISPDGRYVFYLNDEKGAEHGHFIRVPFEGGYGVDITPFMPLYFSYEVSVNEDNNLICFFASNEGKNKVYLVSFDSNDQPLDPYLLYESTKSIQGAILSPNGKYTCVSILSDSLTTSSEIIIFDNENKKTIYSLPNIKGSLVPHAFSKNEKKLVILGLSNRNDFYRPVMVYPSKKNINEIKNVNFKGDVFVMNWINNENQLLLCDISEAKQSLLLLDLKNNSMKKIGPDNGTFDSFFNSVAIFPDESIIMKWHSFTNPPRVLRLQYPNYKKITDVFNSKSIIKNDKAFKSVNFYSSDKTKVQMWIAQPRSKKKNNPFVIDIHGGPHGFVGDEFSAKAQAWLDKGFGYCAVNYRGSIGFGKKFMEGIYGNPGKWEVEDIVAARNWLVKKGLADPQKIILSGWSWGGYVVLLALGKYPELWAGGIAGTPIADCVLQYEDEPAYFQALDRKRFLGTPSEVPKIYKNSSPITYAKNFQAPVFIIHGENDVRCPPRQIEQFRRALKREGKKIKIKKFSSGHAGEFSNTKIRVANVKMALDFAMKIIGKPLSKNLFKRG
jgi:dipeptidyl aminopeptidase/acylaminoacyl peptidase